MSVWQPLSLLREGAIFATQDGVYAVKTEYSNEGSPYQSQCVLLESGEYAYFPQGNRTLVREVKLSREDERMQFLVEAVASLKKDFTLSMVVAVWNDAGE